MCTGRLSIPFPGVMKAVRSLAPQIPTEDERNVAVQSVTRAPTALLLPNYFGSLVRGKSMGSSIAIHVQENTSCAQH